MQDLADELGVSESRISQLRAEALLLLRDGVNSQLEPDAVPAEPRPNGRVARRKASYYAAVASGSDYRTRLTARDDRGRRGRGAVGPPRGRGRRPHLTRAIKAEIRRPGPSTSPSRDGGPKVVAE